MIARSGTTAASRCWRADKRSASSKITFTPALSR